MTHLSLPLRARRAANLLNLATPFGLLVARAGGARVRPGPRGLLIAEGYRLPFPYAGAFTVGNVVVVRGDLAALARWHPDALRHEDEHAWQWMACLGLPFLPLYGLAVIASVAVGGDRAAHNPFERAADLARGGYASRPPRWLRPR
ncbi:hypothetical protein [Mariniluteicoccus flavus]